MLASRFKSYIEYRLTKNPKIYILDSFLKYYRRLLRSPRFLAFLEYKLRKNPQNPRTYYWLGKFYYVRMSDNEGEAKRIAGSKSLEYYECWLGLANANIIYGEYSQVEYMAYIAFEIGQYTKAKKFASMLLYYQESYPLRVANNIYHGNVVLGRLALSKGDFRRAKKYLLKAAKTKGSPQLSSYGPGLSLVRELFEVGEKAVVVEYLQLCKSFWKFDMGRLDRWIQEIERGEIPGFAKKIK